MAEHLRGHEIYTSPEIWRLWLTRKQRALQKPTIFQWVFDGPAVKQAVEAIERYRTSQAATESNKISQAAAVEKKRQAAAEEKKRQTEATLRAALEKLQHTFGEQRASGSSYLSQVSTSTQTSQQRQALNAHLSRAGAGSSYNVPSVMRAGGLTTRSTTMNGPSMNMVPMASSMTSH
ncbi:hypothetical protein P389DRAFT_60941 [Cystobasidium minutum MCA 4210]|uniref:uncharacterized protein n=1 Tax=Cystobasidium minutum MCA 4210 TaxID=1397322 RepID=UPI0034CE5994|eukprot:jgi/Rhomi1/60941/CE60940_2543